MEWFRRLKASLSVFLVTWHQTHRPEPVRFDHSGEPEQWHTHDEPFEPEDIVWIEEAEGPRTRQLRPGLIVSNSVATLQQCTSHNLALLDSGDGIASDFQIIIREAHAAAFKPGGQAKREYTSFARTEIGAFEFGSRIQLRFFLTSGLSLFLPVSVPLFGSLPKIPLKVESHPQTGSLVLIATDDKGRSDPECKPLSGRINGLVPIASQSEEYGMSLAYATYAVVECDPNVLEKATIDVYVAFISDMSKRLPSLGRSTIMAGFASSMDALDFMPRFDFNAKPRHALSIVPCSSSLLFTFVTNQAGFDTGITIANTSLDPYGTEIEAGPITLYYYGSVTGGGPVPPPQKSQTVAPGNQLIFTLSNGGNFGICAAPGFQGYIIAHANFRHCHGVAFINPIGARRRGENARCGSAVAAISPQQSSSLAAGGKA